VVVAPGEGVVLDDGAAGTVGDVDLDGGLGQEETTNTSENGHDMILRSGNGKSVLYGRQPWVRDPPHIIHRDLFVTDHVVPGFAPAMGRAMRRDRRRGGGCSSR